MTTAVRYDTFTSDLSPELTGYETTIPLALNYDGPFSFSIETAYSSAHTEDGSERNQLSHFTDTALSASYAYTNEERWGLLAGVEVNLPTGKAQLSPQERRAEFGQDGNFFLVDDFGEGTNIGAYLGASRQFADANAAIHGGYIARGEYDPTSDIERDELDPGDELVLFGTVEWQATPRFRLAPLVSYVYYQEDQVHGNSSFQADPQITVGGNLASSFGKTIAQFDVYASYQGAGKQTSNSVSVEQFATSQGDNLFSAISLDRTLSERWSFGGVGSFRYYQESDLIWPGNRLPVLGKRLCYDFGMNLAFRPDTRMTWHGEATVFMVDADAYAFLPEDVQYTGVHLTLRATYEF